MEFSKTYYIRKQKMETLKVPTMTEVNAQLGKPLAEVHFNSCPVSLQNEMVLNPLNGPGLDLWVSPSDILMDKVVLKPPLTLKHIRALTHQAILEIGQEIECKYYRVLEEQKRKELDEQQEVLLFMAEKEREHAVKEAIAREHEIFKLKLMQLNEEFEQLLQEELLKLENHLKEIYEQLFEERARHMLEEQEAVAQIRIEEAVSAAIEQLTKKFLEDLEEQEKFLAEIFQSKLQGQKEKYKKLLRNEQEVFEMMLRQLKHNLQCNNIANLMYVLCMEKRNCLREKQEVINDYDKKIEELQCKVTQQVVEIETLKNERNEKHRQCEIRESCLYGVICQFQKFINFALKAAPTQAEFLLSVKKMMTFELAQAIVQVSPNKHQCKQLMPWRTESRGSDRTADMLLQDYHDCLNETTPVKETQNVTSDDSLKAFNFNSRLYVREDFRNKVMQGFFVKSSNMIWNKDVEHLVQLLKTSFQKDSASVNESMQHQRSHISSVHFNSWDNGDLASASLERQDDSEKVGLLGTVDSVILQKSIRSHHSIYDTVPRASFNSNNTPGCAILATRDSLSIPKMDMLAKRRHGPEDEGDLEYEMFKTISTATIKLPKPHKKSEQIVMSDFRNISNATIHLREGKKSDPSIYKYESSTQKQERKLGTKSDARLERSPSHHRNSLEVIKEHLYKKQSHIKNLLQVSYVEMKNPTHFALDVPAESKKLDVNFKQVATLYTDLSKRDQPWKLYEPEGLPKQSVKMDLSPRDDFLTKPNEAKIMGRVGTEHKESDKDFTVHRLHSIIDILKQDRSLIRIFTNCAQ